MGISQYNQWKIEIVVIAVPVVMTHLVMKVADFLSGQLPSAQPVQRDQVWFCEQTDR